VLPELLQSTNYSLLLFSQAIADVLSEESIKSILGDQVINILKQTQVQIKSSAEPIFLSGIFKGLYNKSKSLSDKYLSEFSK
jgi:hypothetical protein